MKFPRRIAAETGRWALWALCLLAVPVWAYEEILTPYADGGLAAPFSLTQIDPFEPKLRWGSEPRLTYAEILERTDFIYRYYASVLEFPPEEIAALRAWDRAANPGTFAYATCRPPRSDKYRGVLRIAATRPMHAFFAPWPVEHVPHFTPLPMEDKYRHLGLADYVRRKYPWRVELGRFASDDPEPLRRIDTLTRLLRATGIFLSDSLREGTILIESPDENVELYEQYGFRVDPDGPMPPGRHLMTLPVRELAHRLAGVLEAALYLPEGVDIYSREAADLALAQLAAAEQTLPRLFRRLLGAADYHRALTLAQHGRGREALPLVERLKRQYDGGEPELLALELEVRSRALVDFWRGTGDAEAAATWLESPEVASGYRTHDYDRYTVYDDRLFWLSMAHLTAGVPEKALPVRDAFARGHYDRPDRGRLVFERMGANEIENVEKRPVLAERITHARYLYTTPPIGLSPTFTRFCGKLLRDAGDLALAGAMDRRAAALESK